MIPFQDLDNLYICIINVDITSACDILAKYIQFANEAALIRAKWETRNLHIQNTEYTSPRGRTIAVRDANQEAIKSLCKVHTTAVTIYKKFIQNKNFILYKLNS